MNIVNNNSANKVFLLFRMVMNVRTSMMMRRMTLIGMYKIPLCPPFEKVIDLSRNNRGKWYKVKFQGRKGTKWVQHGFFDVPQNLIDDSLQKKNMGRDCQKT